MSVSRTDGSNDKGVVRAETAAPSTCRCLVQMDLMTRVLYVREQQPLIRFGVSYRWI